MTPQEAIRKVHCCMHINNDDILQAQELAISALELKQQLDDLGLTIEDVKAMKESIVSLADKHQIGVNLMIKMICDKCGKDCGRIAYDFLIHLLHNPTYGKDNFLDGKVNG